VKRFFIPIILLFSLLIVACNASTDLSVAEAWARPAPAGQNSAVYFQIRNDSQDDEALLRVEGTLARALEVHMTMAMDIADDELDGMIDSANDGMEMGDVMQMLPQERVVIPAGESVVFEPGSLHVMMIDINEVLMAGDHFSLTLVFDSGLRIDIDAEVLAP